jgi:lipopolysaccharide biosynthesis glycosyltransferase
VLVFLNVKKWWVSGRGGEEERRTVVRWSYKPSSFWESTTAGAIHIALCYDTGEYNVGLKALLNSVIQNTKNPQRLWFHFIALEEHLSKLLPFLDELREKHLGLKFDHSLWRLWDEVQGHYPDKNRFKNSLNLARIYMTSLFPEVEKIISLDTDMVLNTDIAELWDTSDLSFFPIAAAASASPIGRYVHHDHPIFLDHTFLFPSNNNNNNNDSNNNDRIAEERRFDFEQLTFSCGIFVANLTRWKEMGFVERIHHVLEEHKKSAILTDTTLKKTLVNLVFHQNWYRMPGEWNGGNCQMTLGEAVKQKMLHFSGSLMSKPWDELSQCTKAVRRLWFHYYLLAEYNS